jgi:NADH-quinone oxidoreductase subunit F
MLERIDIGEATPIDLEIMAQVQQNIMGNCLCVLGDSMAMPIASMIEKLRPEFEEHMERARSARDYRVDAPPLGAGELASAGHSGLEGI